MAKTIISEGKTTNEAIEKGLKELHAKKSDVEIKVIEEEEKRSFFSILDPRVVKVELTVKDEEALNKRIEEEAKHEKEEPVKKEHKTASEEDVETAKKHIDAFLKDFLKQFNNLTYTLDVTDKDLINVVIDGDDSGVLIGYRGDVINALQNLIAAVANKDVTSRVRVSVDIANYKEKREETLKSLAHKLEKTVKRTGKKIVLEPMTAYERKIIHTELQGSNAVETYSIGEEPHRKIVIDVK
jgi:spoIIIJ-associated protein